MSRYDDANDNNTASAVKAGIALAEPVTLVEGHAIAFTLPEGAKVETVDIEKFLDRPTRKRGQYVFGDAKSFIEYVNREKTPETIILADREGAKFKAVFNGNEAENIANEGSRDTGPRPGWGDYTAAYECPLSPEWRLWKSKNGVKMPQGEFAVFIEDNFADIVEPLPTFDPTYTNWPDGDMMLRVARGLEAKNNVTFASALRTDNGQVQFKYEEEISGVVQGGLFEVPQKFAIGVPIFAGTAPWQIVARLRYRIEKGGLTMWFDFERLFKITERAFDEARNEIASGTGVPIFLGSRS